MFHRYPTGSVLWAVPALIYGVLPAPPFQSPLYCTELPAGLPAATPGKSHLHNLCRAAVLSDSSPQPFPTLLQ